MRVRGGCVAPPRSGPRVARLEENFGFGGCHLAENQGSRNHMHYSQQGRYAPIPAGALRAHTLSVKGATRPYAICLYQGRMLRTCAISLSHSFTTLNIQHTKSPLILYRTYALDCMSKVRKLLSVSTSPCRIHRVRVTQMERSNHQEHHRW